MHWGPQAAFANLERALALLQRNALPEGRYRVQVIANYLRELDQLLNLLIDEVAIAADPIRFARATLSRQRNTAAKLDNLRRLLQIPNPDDRRLRAIGRSRDCLFHCKGIVRRPDQRGGDSMTAGWPDEHFALRTFALGGPLGLAKRDLDDVCRFYGEIARSLITDRISTSAAPFSTLP